MKTGSPVRDAFFTIEDASCRSSLMGTMLGIALIGGTSFGSEDTTTGGARLVCLAAPPESLEVSRSSVACASPPRGPSAGPSEQLAILLTFWRGHDTAAAFT